MSNLQKYIINGKPFYGLSSRFITIKGTNYEIIGGESTGKGANEVIYDVKNLSTGEIKQHSMDRIIRELMPKDGLRSINAKS